MRRPGIIAGLLFCFFSRIEIKNNLQFLKQGKNCPHKPPQAPTSPDTLPGIHKYTPGKLRAYKAKVNKHTKIRGHASPGKEAESVGKGSMPYKAIKMTYNGQVKVAGYSPLARQLIGLYRAEYSPRHGRYRLVDNCSTHEIVYHTKQIKSFRKRFQPCFRARRGKVENICKYLFLYIFVLLGFCTDVCAKKFLKKFWFICCDCNLKEYNEIKN